MQDLPFIQGNSAFFDMLRHWSGASESDMFRVPSVMLGYAGNLKCMLKIENHIVEILCIPSNVTTGILSPTVASNLLPLDSAANMIVCEQAGRAPHLGYNLSF